jgi:hypothetical protein
MLCQKVIRRYIVVVIFKFITLYNFRVLSEHPSILTLYKLGGNIYIVLCQKILKGALQSFFNLKTTLSRGFHGDLFGCILHAVSMSTSTFAHRNTHACCGAHVK